MTTATETRKVPLAACRVRDAVQFELLAAEDPNQPTVKRQWQMVATTGKTLTRWWGDLVLDLDGAKFKQRLALLMDHDTGQRLGYSTAVKRSERGIEASGKLLRNDAAAQVLDEAGQGFPFQASLMAVPVRAQVLDEGEETLVNGRTVQGPVTIFREWNLRELTLTVLGADDDTTTEAFAADGEIEVEMTMTTKNEEPATKLANGQTTPASTSPQPAPAPQPNHEAVVKATADAERARCTAIAKAAGKGQAELAAKLIADGASVEEALSAILADVRAKQALAPSPATEPKGAGNAGSDQTEQQRLAALPEGPEKWKAQYAADAALRNEFLSADSYVAFKRSMPEA